MAQLWATVWRRGNTSDNVPTHSASLSLLAKSRMCHTPSEAWGGHRGVTLCQHLWEHFISTHQTIRRNWSEFSTGTLARGVLLTLTPVRLQTPSFWLLSLLFGKCRLFRLFLLIILRAMGFFFVISFSNKSAETGGIIFKQELPKEQPLLAKSNCRAHQGQG